MTETEPIRILYMEDDAGLARLVQRNLEREGYVVDIACDGAEGLAMYDAGSYDIVLIDQSMPVYNGLEVIRIMVSQGPLPPMIMVTGTGDEMTAVDAMKLGAGDYIVKDVVGGYLKLLPSVIEQVLHQQQAEKVLRQTEREKAAILNGMSELVSYRDKNMRILWANKATSESVGATTEELVGRYCYEIWHQQSKPCPHCPVVRALKTGQPHESEVTTPDGRIWFVRGYPDIDVDGNITGVIEVTLEITDHKRAEERQSLITEGLRAVMAAADELITCPDVDTLFRRAVELARDKLGLERCSIFLEDDGYMRGTYGTGLDGSITDEHRDRFPMDEDWWSVQWARFQLLHPRDPQWVIVQDMHHEWDGEQRVSIGEGWLAVTRIQSQAGRIGAFFNDAAISGAEFDEAKQEIVAVYCSLLGNIIERKQAEELLRSEKDFAEGLVNTAQVIVLVLDTEGRIVRFNPYMEEISGYQLQEVQGKDWFTTFLPKRDQNGIRDLFLQAISDIQTRGNVNPIVTRDGRERKIEWYDKTLKDANGNVVGLLAIGQDVTERKRAEAQIKTSLKEKEILLQEIHHRVKNNLQVISSLLSLQSDYVQDKQILEMLNESRSRIRSMALIHELLYQSEDLAQVDFHQYIRSMTGYLYQSYANKLGAITMNINVDDSISLDVDTAIPCGLIITEVVSNSLKYAFPEGKKGEIHIEFTEDDNGEFTLIVSNNGVAFPEDLDFRNAKSLGLRLVTALTDQLKGTIELDRSCGTLFKITFRANRKGG